MHIGNGRKLMSLIAKAFIQPFTRLFGPQHLKHSFQFVFPNGVVVALDQVFYEPS